MNIILTILFLLILHFVCKFITNIIVYIINKFLEYRDNK